MHSVTSLVANFGEFPFHSTRVNRARRERAGVFVLDKDSGHPFGQGESLLY
jgi:hypothetical protein